MPLKPAALAVMKLAPAYAGAGISLSQVNMAVSIAAGVFTGLYSLVMAVSAGWSLHEKIKASRVKPVGSHRTRQDE